MDVMSSSNICARTEPISMPKVADVNVLIAFESLFLSSNEVKAKIAFCISFGGVTKPVTLQHSEASIVVNTEKGNTSNT